MTSLSETELGAMTRVSPDFGDEVQAVWTVSADASFQTNQFPKYKLGPDNEILEEIKEDSKGPPLKEVVVQEINQLTQQHKRLSVRDLASKFDKNLAAAAKLSEEVSLKCQCFLVFALLLLFKYRDINICINNMLGHNFTFILNDHTEDNILKNHLLYATELLLFDLI